MWSVTSLMVYETCPRQFHRTYVLKLPQPVTPAMRAGSSVHALIAAQFGQLPLLAPPVDPEMQRLVEAFTRSRFNQAPIAFERPFKVQVAGGHVAGRIDLVIPAPDGKIELVDFKSGRPRSREDMNASLQLPLYSLATSVEYGLGPERIRYTYFFLRDGAELTFDASSEAFSSVSSRVERILAGIQSGRFESRPGCSCFACRGTRSKTARLR